MRDGTDMLGSVKHGIDALSLGIAFGTLVQALPSVAAILTIVWTLIRIYETKTVQAMLGRAAAKD